MIRKFEFLQPGNLQEALKLLDLYLGSRNARLIAGGTDVIPGFQQEASRFMDVDLVIDIHGLEELKIIKRENSVVTIGAGVTFSELTCNPVINQLYPLLAKAASSIGSVQIRNRATIAGNFVNNAPCADSVAPLLVYDATIHVQSHSRNRKILLEDFLIKPYKTQLQPDEIVTRLSLPIPGDNYRGDFYKLGRRRGVAISRISLALLVQLQDSVIQDLRIASGAVTPIGKRFRQLENRARGKTANSDLFEQLSIQLGQQILEITGLRWSSDYKLPVVQQMFYQLLVDIL